MYKLNKISKTLLFLFVIFGVIWLGSYITRLSLFYQLFKPEELVLREFINDQNMIGIVTILITAVSINLFFYIAMIVIFILFLFTSKINLKINGWLFIATVLIFITLPFEFYLMLIDYQMLTVVWNDGHDSQEILKLIVKRFTALSSFPIVEILAYFAIIYLFLFQPLKGIKRKILE